MSSRGPSDDDASPTAVRRRSLVTGELVSDDFIETLGGFPVVRLIAKGSVGRVFECVDNQSPPPEQGRHVAIKLLSEAFTGEEVLDRLRRQAILLGGVHSHCVGRVFGVGEHEGAPFIMEELLRGENLQAMVDREGRLTPRVALRAVRDAARGLNAALEVGVTHGDVRPANLWLFDGRVKLVDFGLGGHIRPSLPDAVALAHTLYTLLTGRTLVETFDNHIDETHLPNPGAASIRALLASMLDRVDPPSWEHLVLQLEDAIAGRPLTLAVTPKAPKPSPPKETPDPVDVPFPPPLLSASGPAEPAGDPDSLQSPFGATGSNPSTSPFVGVPSGIMGSLKQMSVTEIAQTLELGRKTARVELTPLSGPPGGFACRAGRVVHARCGDVVGEEAFFALAVHADGYFRIHYGEDSVEEPNINAPTQFLLLETMRRIDERQTATAPPTKPTPLAPAPLPSAPSSRPFAFPASEPAPAFSPPGLPSFSPSSEPSQPVPSPFSSPFSSPVSEPSQPSVPSPFSSPDEAPVSPSVHVSPFPPSFSSVFSSPPPASPPMDAPAKPGAAPSTIKPALKPAAQPTPELGEHDTVEVSVAAALDRGFANLPHTMPEAPPAPPARGFSEFNVATDEVNRGLRPLRAVTGVFDGLFVRARDQLTAHAPLMASGVAKVEAALTARPWLLLLPMLLVIVVGVAIGQAGFSYAEALAEIDAGHAKDVLADLEHPSSPEELLARAHALAALEKDDEALVAYAAAAAAPLVDDRALEWVLRRLSSPAPDRALDLLQRWPDMRARRRLTELTANPDWNIRHNAATALRERGELGDVETEQVAVLDLSTAPQCSARRDALLVLKSVGKTESARKAIEEASLTRKGENRCLAGDVNAALSAVVSRSAPP